MPLTTETPQIPLATLLAQAPLPPQQALRETIHHAQTLRVSHESGRGRGAGESWGDTDALRPYTPPEVLAGGPVDVRSDVYTLGAILYHLLSGKPPFPPPLEVPSAHVPGLEAVVLRSLETDPNRRWQNLQIFSIELKLLCAAADRLQPTQDRLASLESALEARVAATEQALPALREAVKETRDYVRTAFEFVEDRLRCQAVVIEKLQTAARQSEEGLDQLATSIALCERSTSEILRNAERSAATGAAAARQIEDRFAAQSHSIDDLLASAARTDDLLERVVESIDSLQSFVLNRTGK